MLLGSMLFDPNMDVRQGNGGQDPSLTKLTLCNLLISNKHNVDVTIEFSFDLEML